ncbi:YwaF family protein [[Mycoplasma] gypis]|uniref:YwaF family protein n=1 Tax=[Mycoplasma] gypis TaxID=92404 RepID=A0ABZ2RQB8_9BACT
MNYTIEMSLQENSKVELVRPKNYGFFNWQGGYLTFHQSSWFFFLVVAIVLCVCALLWLFRKPIYYKYENTQTILKMSKKTFWLIVGIIAACFTIFRIIVLFLNHYPNRWEIIPLHYCRLFLVFIILSLVFNRIDLSKYYGIFEVVGVLIAFGFTDLSSNEKWRSLSADHSDIFWGFDSFVFWDFLFAHSFIIIMCFLLMILSSAKQTKKTVFISVVAMFLIALSVLVLNYITFKYAQNTWKSNWFYLGMQEVNSLSELFGKLSRQPYLFLIACFSIMCLYALALLIFFSASKISLQKVENKWKFIVSKSVAWNDFKQSHLSFKNKNKTV